MTSISSIADRTSAPTPQRLGVCGITKIFGDFKANSDVTLSIDHGEIHAILGENGAGKSTLVKMIYGIMSPDAGEMILDGEAYHPRSPSDAKSAGVAMVFQHFAIFDAMTVLENIALGLEGRFPTKILADEILVLCDRYHLHVELHRRVADLGAGERQRVEIIRVLMQNPTLLILDEPTSVLTPQETDELFETLKRLSDEGRSIIYISHKLDDVRSLCDQATLLRGGCVIDVVDPRKETSLSLGEKMIGERVRETKRCYKPPASEKARLSIRVGEFTPGDDHAIALSNIYMTLMPGSILGIAGVAGNGQDTLFDMLSGELLVDNPESIQLDGEVIGHLGIIERRRRKMLFAPENRLGHAAIPELMLWENVILTARESQNIVQQNGHLISSEQAKWFAESVVDQFDVRTHSVDSKASSLSGGNLQKFLIGRELLGEPQLFVVSNPTWGVDTKAQQFIHQALIDLAASGASVIMISQDIDELLAVSDHICALCHGRLSRTLPTDVMTSEQLGTLMLGQEDGL